MTSIRFQCPFPLFCFIAVFTSSTVHKCTNVWFQHNAVPPSHGTNSSYIKIATYMKKKTFLKQREKNRMRWETRTVSLLTHGRTLQKASYTKYYTNAVPDAIASSILKEWNTNCMVCWRSCKIHTLINSVSEFGNSRNTSCFFLVTLQQWQWQCN